MKRTEFRDCLERMALTQVEASELFRIDPRTGRRYAGKDASIPFAVGALLRFLVTGERVTIKALREMKD